MQNMNKAKKLLALLLALAMVLALAACGNNASTSSTPRVFRQQYRFR